MTSVSNHVSCIAFSSLTLSDHMMTSSNGNIFRVTGPLCGEFTGPRWIPLTKASDAEPWCSLWSAPWINGWVNNREAGDLRRHRAHYDVFVMQRRRISWGASDLSWHYSFVIHVSSETLDQLPPFVTSSRSLAVLRSSGGTASVL